MAQRDIIVIGGSAGSGAVLRRMFRDLPADLPASLFVTTHIPSTHASYLPEALRGLGGPRAVLAVDGQPVEQATAYFAPPDRHLLPEGGVIRLGSGPRENHARPAIDPMFRSAALTYGARTVGVILTGWLDDGASGLSAVKQVGGLAVVQHPRDAEAPDMPRAALEAVEADHVTRADQLGALLAGIVGTEAGPNLAPTENLQFEVDVAAGAQRGTPSLRRVADVVPLTCPDCQGVLSEVRGAQPLRFRCQIGHAFTAESLAERDERLNQALAVAMRVMEERLELVARMARDARNTGRTAVAELYEARAVEYESYAVTLRDAALAAHRARRGGDAAS